MRSIKITSIVAALAIGTIMASCDPQGTDNAKELTAEEAKELTAEEAKIEIKAANQQIISLKSDMLNAEGYSTLNYFYELTMGQSLKSATTNRKFFQQKHTLTSVLNTYRNKINLKSAKLDDENSFFGTFEYNFETETIEYVSENNTALKVKYPADETARINKKLNAEMTITNIKTSEILSEEEDYNWETGEMEMVETTEMIPTSADVVMTVEGKSTFTANYLATYTADGMPTKVEMGAKTKDYSTEMSFKGSAETYTTTFSQKMGKDVVTGYDLTVKYTSDMSEVETMSGYYTVTPLKFEGKINVKAIQTEMDKADQSSTTANITTLNTYLDLAVMQSEINQKIGTVQFVLKTLDGSTYPELAIVYSDGTSEWLGDVLTVFE